MINIVVFSIQQCDKELFMRSLNNTSFGINPLVVFGEILVLEWKINKRTIFDPEIIFLLEEAYS